MNRFLALLSVWHRVTQELETTVADLMTASVPWLAPILPAWLVTVGVYGMVERNLVFAGLAGLVVEILGISTITTTVRFWSHNQDVTERERYRIADRAERCKSTNVRREWRAPTSLAALSALYYLSIVIIASVILDRDAEQPFVLVIKALLSSTSVVGAVVLGLRSQYAARTGLHRMQLHNVNSVQLHNVHAAQSSQTLKTMLQSPRRQRTSFPQGDISSIAGSNIGDLINRYGISRRTTYNWRNKATDELTLMKTSPSETH